MQLPDSNLSMLTLVKAEGLMELFLRRLPLAAPKVHEVVVRIEATPINPSDLGLMIGAADAGSARAFERDGLPGLAMNVPEFGMRAMAARVGEALPIGNEGFGEVIAAGNAPEAQALLGKKVALIGGAIYAEYRTLPAEMCMVLPDDTDPRDGASCFVNPLTAQAFVEVMQSGGFSGIVHTAAASNLGQMLVKICAADGVPLINIVRTEEQVALLKGLGATHVLNSAAEGFMADLVAALVETGAMLGFDAIGGGKMAGQILAAMEQAASKRMTSYSRYGSDEMKQLYIYGALDPGPTFLTRSFGFAWGLGGFLLTPFLAKAGMEVNVRLRKRVIDELTTTFASSYSHEISLEQAVSVDVMQGYNAKRTGEKYLIRP